MARWLKHSIWSSGELLDRDFLLAVLMAAALPSTAGLLLIWLFPTGCDLRGDASIYRWTCLMPGLLVAVPIVAAPLLSIGMYVNCRGRRPSGRRDRRRSRDRR